MRDPKKLCYACDLIDDPQRIAAYKKHHETIWPEIKKSITDAGILNMEIYLCENRLFMIMEVRGDYDPVKKQHMDESNPKVQEWENLMWKYQQALPTAKKGEKWSLMEPIFKLTDFLDDSL